MATHRATLTMAATNRFCLHQQGKKSVQRLWEVNAFNAIIRKVWLTESGTGVGATESANGLPRSGPDGRRRINGGAVCCTPLNILIARVRLRRFRAVGRFGQQLRLPRGTASSSEIGVTNIRDIGTVSIEPSRTLLRHDAKRTNVSRRPRRIPNLSTAMTEYSEQVG